MILLISSAASRRYSDDIVRALAHPVGTTFQFRYDRKHLDPSLLAEAARGRFSDPSALIAFLHATQPTTAAPGVAELTSVRTVKISRVEMVGTSCVLTLIAGAYVRPLADADIRTALTPAETALLPAWHGAVLDGHFAIAVTKNIQARRTAQAGEEMEAFEETAIALSKYPSFDPQSGIAFFAVRDLVVDEPLPSRRWRVDPSPVLSADRYRLRSGFRYRIDIYTYRSAGGATSSTPTMLTITTDEKAIQFTTSKDVVLDSRYDLNRFSFTTDQLLNAVPAAIRVGLTITSGTPSSIAEQRCDITLSTLFAGWQPQACIRAAAIAVGTASSAIIGIAFKDNPAWWVYILMLIGPTVAAYASTFPLLRKAG